MCDGRAEYMGDGNYVVFSSRGGVITFVEGTQPILPKDSCKTTKFRRVGMVYRMDARVRKSDVMKRSWGFQGQGSR